MKLARLSLSARILFLAFALSAANTVESQVPARFQIQAIALSGTEFVGTGLGFARSLSNRLEITVSTNIGTEADRTRLRVEGAAVFHVQPVATEGWGLYGGIGAAVHTIGLPTREYLMLLLGVEPNSRKGLFFETGIGGGARVAVGYRSPIGGQ